MRHLKGVLNLDKKYLEEAEIIPKEPGQVMLPREIALIESAGTSIEPPVRSIERSYQGFFMLNF